MRCRYCGEENIENATNCIKCGNPLNNVNKQNNIVIKNRNIISKLKRINKKVWIGIFVVIVIILLIIFFTTKGKKNNNEANDVYNEKFTITKSEAFFLKGEDTEGYALFSSDGKKLTDYIYKTEKATFYNHAALVENLEGKKCAINDSGKTIIKCGEYDELTNVKASFKAKKGDTTSLIDSKGKIIKSFTGYVDTDSYIDYDEFILVSNNDKYYVIDYEGDIVLTFDEIKDADSPSVNYSNGIISYFYNGKTYIIDIKKNKQITTLDDKNHLCVNSTDQKGNVIVLQSCTSWLDSIDKKRYIVLDKGNITYDTNNDDSCESISYFQKSLRCYKNNDIYFIDTNGKKINDANVKNIGYTDVKDYVDYKSEEVIFYKNNKEVSKVKGSLQDTGYSKEGKYIIKVSDGYMLYNSDGKPVVDKIFKKIYSYYGNYYYAKVDDNNYVFTLNNKISDSYYSVGNNIDKYYYVETKKDTHNIVDSDTGKTVLPDSSESYKAFIRDDVVIAYTYVDGKTTMYNLKTGKEIIKVDGELKLYDYYFTYINDGTKEYYSYKTGKKFLESKNN